MLVNSLLGNLVEMNSSQIHSILDIPFVFEFKQKCVNFRKSELLCLYTSIPMLKLYIYMSRTKCKIRAVVAMHSTSVSLLPRCSWAPTERHSSPVEAVLTGNGVALPGLIEIPKSSVGHGAID